MSYKIRHTIRRRTGALLSVGLMLTGCDVGHQPNNVPVTPSDVGKSAIAGAISVEHGLPEKFGGTVASTVSIGARDKGQLLLHASGVKIGPNEVLTAGHIIYDLRGGYGPDPQPGYCATNPGFDLEAGFSDPNGKGSTVHVTGVALSDRRDLAVLTVDRTPSFDKIPSAPITKTNGDDMPVKSSVIMMAGYPTHVGDGMQVQDPSRTGEYADVYVWKGPVGTADNYYATITLPAGIEGDGTSGGPIISGGRLVGIVHGGAISPGGTGSVAMEHTIGVDQLANKAPGSIC